MGKASRRKRERKVVNESLEILSDKRQLDYVENNQSVRNHREIGPAEAETSFDWIDDDQSLVDTTVVSPLYRYFEEAGHADAWVSGGQVPIRQALYYRTLEGGSGRADADDSVHQKVDGASLSSLVDPISGFKVFDIAPGANVNIKGGRIIIRNSYGVRVIEKFRHKRTHVSGLILCLSTKFGRQTAEAIDPKCKYCVKILDVEKLKNVIDKAINCTSVGSPIKYTTSDDRNFFLKNSAYEPQAEYRFVWRDIAAQEIWIDLPSGIGCHVDIP